MFYSQKFKILVIGIPKTGSTTIEESLIRLDPQGEKHSITIAGRKFLSDESHQGILGHARAVEIKKLLGPKSYNELRSIAFVRHPFEKLVSAYHFNYSNSLLSFLKIKGKKKSFSRKAKNFITILIAKLFPFQLWAFIYPYKSNYGYVFDKKGERIVQYIGRTEHLTSDLNHILNKLEIDTSNLKVEHLNASKHRKYETYFTSRLFKFLISIKVRKDLKLYKEVCLEWTNN